VLTEGYSSLMVEITGVILDSVRPARMIWEGRPAAMEIAVSAPMPPFPGPVMTTEVVSDESCQQRLNLLVLSFIRSLNASTTSSPVEVNIQRVIVETSGLSCQV